MTERCQTKFTEKFDNFNYIIYLGILCTSVAVLLFYRFHFTAVGFCYGLGCLACYYGINSSILVEYVEKLKLQLLGHCAVKKLEHAPKKRCSACGSKECERHDTGISTEPWVGLQIHKQLDQAIEDFYNTILEQFISTWYNKITLQPFFVDELRHQLRYASASLLQRAVKINYSKFIMGRLIPCALQHYSAHGSRAARARAVHVAARSRLAELKYLRCVADRLMPIVLRDGEVHNPVFRVLIREIFAGWVLLSLTDVLSEPFALNTLIARATSEETMAALPSTPHYKRQNLTAVRPAGAGQRFRLLDSDMCVRRQESVEFLETFARQTDSIYVQRCKLMKIDLDLVMSDQEYFYSFMQYLKTTNHIFLLQFYKDIKSFQTKLLNPELSETEKRYLHKEASDIYDTYLREDSASRVPLQDNISEELYQLLQAEDSVKRLQTSRALYQAARQSHAFLEKILLPKFLHSEEFYKLLIGSRISTGYQKNMTRKPHEHLLTSALKLGNKLKSALKASNLDGQIIDTLDDENAELDNVGILKYLETLAADEMQGHDLTSYKVVLTNVETRLAAPPRRGTVRVFSLAVHGAPAGAAPRLWAVERSEHDFHLLRGKLLEFHGDQLLLDLPLPSRRDNSPLETLRYKYEDFLQRLLQKRLLQTSEMLRIFLTDDGDFSLVIQATTLSASTDLVNIYQNVTYKLRKEKGQHLESFMTNLLVSSDIERYQALKHGAHIEEAFEVSEEIEISQTRGHQKRNIVGGIFGNNMDIDDETVSVVDRQYQTTVVGFTQCFMYLLTKVIKARLFVVHILGTVLGLLRELVDESFNRLLNTVLYDVVSERRLAHLIRLGHALLFGKKPPTHHDPEQTREMARAQLLASVPRGAAALLGPGLPASVMTAFDLIQQPQLNKQLVYNLLDLCIVELFPELNNENENPT